MKKGQQKDNKTPPRSVIVHGKIRYVDQYNAPDGKRIRRFYKTAQELADAKAARHALKKSELSAVIDKKFPPETVLDIGAAIKLLPNGMTLAECVKIASKYRVPQKDANTCLNEFFDTKKGKISNHYLSSSKSRVKKYIDFCSGFSGVSSESLLSFLSRVSSSEKSKKHFATAIREFFEWCDVREYYRANPFNRLHASDLPQALPKPRKRVPIALIRAFFSDCEKALPHLAGALSLVAFGGLRTSEALKLTRERVDFARREITIPFKDSKTGARRGRSYLQSQMPDNLWEWLERYKLPEAPQGTHIYDGLQGLDSWKSLPDNALRHSFATYHLSLYRAADKTAILMRHSSAQQLWSTYLDELTSEDEGREYFSIAPSAE